MNRPKYDVIMISDGRFTNFTETRPKDVKKMLLIWSKTPLWETWVERRSADRHGHNIFLKRKAKGAWTQRVKSHATSLVVNVSGAKNRGCKTS